MSHACVSVADTPSRITHDFNTDGQSDIAWRNTNGDLAIWLMNGRWLFRHQWITAVWRLTSWSIVGQRDFNGEAT